MVLFNWVQKDNADCHWTDKDISMWLLYELYAEDIYTWTSAVTDTRTGKDTWVKDERSMSNSSATDNDLGCSHMRPWDPHTRGGFSGEECSFIRWKVTRSISNQADSSKGSEGWRTGCKEWCKGLGSICTINTQIEHIKISDLYFETPPRLPP